MKLNARAIINTGIYQHIEIDVVIDVPEGLGNKELIIWLHGEFKDLLKNRELELARIPAGETLFAPKKVIPPKPLPKKPKIEMKEISKQSAELDAGASTQEKEDIGEPPF